MKNLADYLGKRVIVIHFTHNYPKVETVLGTLNEITEQGIGLKNTLELSPHSHQSIRPSHQKYWTGTWIPFDGYAKVLTIIDKESEEIIYSKEWNQLMIDLFFQGVRTKGEQSYYGKPWSEVPKIDIFRRKMI